MNPLSNTAFGNSTLFFPRPNLLERVCRGFVKKYFSTFIIGSCSPVVRKNHRHDYWTKKNITSPGEKVTIQTPDGILLDGVQIIADEQKSLPPEKQKWLYYILPAKMIWQQIFSPNEQTPEMTHLTTLAKQTGRNVLCVNRRGTGNSSPIRPQSFEDLFLDDDSALHSLKGVLPENTILYAHSIGSTPGLYLAMRYDMKVVVQNTFYRLPLLGKYFARYLVSIVDKFLNRQLHYQQTASLIWKRIFYSTIDAFLSIPHLVLRVTFFFFSCLEHLLSCYWENAIQDLLTIGKTIILDSYLTLLGCINILISLFTNNLNIYSAHLKESYIKHSALKQLAQSSKFIWLAQKILSVAGWNFDNAHAVNSLASRGKVFVVQVPYDKTIPKDVSVAERLFELKSNI